MVWIFNCWFQFPNSALEFYSWIQKFILLIRIHIIGKRFYTCLLAFELNFFIWPCSRYIFNYTVKPCNFQFDEQIFIHCYFLLVLIPEPVLYIWLRCQVCIQYSLAAFRQSPRQISNSTSYNYFQLNFWTFVYPSVIIGRDKRSLCGGGRWRPIDLLRRLFCQATHDFHLKPKYCLLS